MCPTAPPDCPPPDRRPSLQLLALEMVARGRQHGVINSEIARIMGVAARNFFYICKVGAGGRAGEGEV